MDDPVYIVGCPRSGTTLVNFILNKNESCFILNEKGIYCYVFKNWCYIKEKNRGSIEDLKNTFRSILDSHREKQLLDEGDLENIFKYEELEWRNVVLSFFSSLIDKNKPTARVWGDKTPNNIFYLDQILEQQPEARILYVYRNPFHVVNSMSKKDFEYASDKQHINGYITKKYIKKYENSKKIIPESNRLEVRYEKIVEAPEKTTRRMCSFLGIEYSHKMIGKASETTRMLVGWPNSKAWDRIRPQPSSQDVNIGSSVMRYLKDEAEKYNYENKNNSNFMDISSALTVYVRLIPYMVLNGLYNMLRRTKYPTYQSEVLQGTPSKKDIKNWIKKGIENCAN
ncbi:hypothetical protein GGQ02_003122 [Salinibacter ruber]|uniref:sulfotransferase family protein n=1 Tax=Salinibacter ruber TaxID=146919 RepID=UPI002167CB74|nr:sulfotransferase [Salinibacter ruber]MCS4034712.1 hypothetical protein [Salinibacter ruber]